MSLHTRRKPPGPPIGKDTQGDDPPETLPRYLRCRDRRFWQARTVTAQPPAERPADIDSLAQGNEIRR